MYKNIIIIKVNLEIYTIRYVVLKPDELQGRNRRNIGKITDKLVKRKKCNYYLKKTAKTIKRPIQQDKFSNKRMEP